MGISIGLVGLGSFGSAFAQLFKAHPLVDRVAFCDCEPERVRKFAEDPFFADKFNPRDAYGSLDEICASDLDALVVITQPWLHAPQCIQAMESGKEVYSAVPLTCLPDSDEVLDWCGRIIETSKRTGRHYMLGETTCFRPQAMFCRRKALTGEFGDFVYAEGEYMHDVDSACSLREVMRRRTAGRIGSEWPAKEEQYARSGKLSTPMNYPTHSVSGPVFCMGTRARKVAAFGWRNRTGDSYFRHDEFSNVTALFELANGASMRVAEMRELAGQISPLENETFRIIGTRGSFSENVWYYNGRTDETDAIRPEQRTRYTDAELFDPLPPEVREAFLTVQNRSSGDLQNRDFVPQGHGGSHPYLVHEFVTSVYERRQPLENAWEAGHYMAMGMAANRSARRDGELTPVQDWGFAPEF